MAGIADLSKKRAAAKGKVTFFVGKLTPLLPLRGQEARDKANEATDFFKKLEVSLTKFKESHKLYTEALEEVTDGANMDRVVEENMKYEFDVEDTVYNTIEQWKVFKARYQMSAAKTNFTEAINVYRGEFASSRTLVEESQEDSIFLSLPAGDVKVSLSRAFNDLVKQRIAYKEILESAKENIDEFIASAETGFVTSGEKFRSDFMEMRNKLASVVNGQNEVRAQQAAQAQAGAAPQVQGQQQTRCPIKLEKAETVKFSGQPRDFSRFKTEFELIVVPDRTDTEIGLRLKQSLPNKHKHLIENYELRDYDGEAKGVLWVLRESHLLCRGRDRETQDAGN